VCCCENRKYAIPGVLFGRTPSAISNVTFPNELHGFMLDQHCHLPGELDFFFVFKTSHCILPYDLHFINKWEERPKACMSGLRTLLMFVFSVDVWAIPGGLIHSVYRYFLSHTARCLRSIIFWQLVSS